MHQMKILALSALLASSFMISAQDVESIPVMDFPEFEELLHQENNTTYIINFWATWCIPCRKELPVFEQINKETGDQKLKVILVSLDMADKVQETLMPYLEKNRITSQVILLDDPDSNSWINKVSPQWSGSIPATLIYKGKNSKFHEKTFEYEGLKKAIEEISNI